MTDEEAFLAHFGTKGMRWGVHKSQNDSWSGTDPRSKSEIYGKRVLIGGAATAAVLGTLAVGAAGYGAHKGLQGGSKYVAKQGPLVLAQAKRKGPILADQVNSEAWKRAPILMDNGRRKVHNIKQLGVVRLGPF